MRFIALTLTFLALTSLFAFTTPQLAQAQEEALDQYEALETIPGVITKGEQVNLTSYLQGLFNFAIGIVAIAALVMITIGGFWYVTSAGNASRATTAKSMIMDAILGLLVALFSWLILNTINPDLVKGGLQSLRPDAVPESPQTEEVSDENTEYCNIGGNCYPTLEECEQLSNTCSQQVEEGANVSPADEDALFSDQQNRDTLSVGGITFNKEYPETSVAYLGDEALINLPSLPLFCDCDVVITGGTEPGHQTHGPGKSIVDLRTTDSLNAYLIGSASGEPAPNSNNDLVYRFPAGHPLAGATATRESTHWHVSWEGS